MELWDEYRRNIEHSIMNAPRSLQPTIGPSELGTPCLRCLTFKLLQEIKQQDTKPHMYTFVGTCVHEHMERFFTALDADRYATELRVQVCELQMPAFDITDRESVVQPIVGSVDVYDYQADATIDWKVSSNDRIQTIRRHGLPQEYFVQASLYGIGILNQTDAAPKLSCVYILPRNGQSLDSALPIEWEYTSEPGEWALDRARQIISLYNSIYYAAGEPMARAWANSMPSCGAASGECWDCMNDTYLPAPLYAAQHALPEVPDVYAHLYATIPSHYTGTIPDYQTIK